MASTLVTVFVTLLLTTLLLSTTLARSDLSARLRRASPLTPTTPLPPSAVPTVTGSVTYDGSSYSFHPSTNATNAVAWGTFKDGLNVTGWGELWLTTSPTFPDLVQMHAAGYLEGALTAGRIWEMYQITASEERVTPAIQAFVDNQTEWVASSIAKAAKGDTYWAGMALIMAQYAGLQAGYNAHPSAVGKAMSRMDFDLLQLSGDWGDIETAVHRELRPDFSKMSPEQVRQWAIERDHCSVLVKLTGDLQEIYASHSTWTDYATMNRIFKHYQLNLQSAFVAAKRVSMSSYPGFLESLDDFYYLDSGLVMLETTNNVFDMNLFDLVTPHSLFAWQRVRLASQNARTGREWYEHVRWHNSGTYNNQYAILDFKLYTPGQPLRPNTLWVMEQIPGLVVGSDQTHLLTFGYFPSYNVPYFEEIYTRSGYPNISAEVPGFAYQDAPRAQIFRRDAGKVGNLTDFQALMRYNHFSVDPISAGNACDAICCRGDLESGGKPFGCTDTKVTSFSLFQKGQAWIVNGPTTSGGFLQPFSWNKYPDVVRSGLPDVFDFDFVLTQW